MPETQPDPEPRPEILLNFWFAEEKASERDRLCNICFQAPRNSTLRSQRASPQFHPMNSTEITQLAQ